MTDILGRLLLRVAILAASLAWAGFVFTQTIGDPARGERIATAVLADDDARAEVSAPITSAVLRATGLPVEQRPFVADQVEGVLRDPAGAQTFVDPFAGSWARMLGEDDPRPAELDLAPVLEQLGATLPEGAAGAGAFADRLPVSGVPLPRVQLDWMSGVRSAISASLVPLALVAVGAFIGAFLTGDRRRVLRRAGVWAVAAGLAWVVIPPVLVWAARRWAPGADAVVAVALDEATSGLLPVALALVAVGAVTFPSSFAVSPGRAGRTVRGSSRRRTTDSARRAVAATPAGQSPAPATRAVPTIRPVTSTREMPQVGGAVAGAPDERTVELPATIRTAPRSVPDQPAVDDDRDALWDYYSGSS